MEYNTKRGDLQYREYGRNVKNIVEYLCTLPDDEEKKQMVESVVKVMGHVSGTPKKDETAEHKLWDHLMVISLFRLEQYWPYSAEELASLKERMKEENTEEKPLLPFITKPIEMRHFGMHLEDMLRKLPSIEDGPEYDELVMQIAGQAKRSYIVWNGDCLDDSIIVEQMFAVSHDPRIARVLDGREIKLSPYSMPTLPGPAAKKKKKNKKKK